MAKQIAKDLINAGVHFGHGVSRWNPKMAPYIFAKRGKIHIINVKETLRGMLIAKKLLAEIAASGKDVVFVGTKRQAQDAVIKAAEKCGMHYVSNRWLGGMLTNFRTIRSRLQRLEELEKMESDQTLGESKKEASRLKRELRKIKANLEGVRNMSRLPGVVVVIDANREHLALHEAKKLGIPTIGIIDTNADPDTLDVAIPGNDDSIRAINIIMDELADAVAVGKTMASAKPTEGQQPKPKARSKRRTLARAEGQQEKKESASAKPSEEETGPIESAETAAKPSEKEEMKAAEEESAGKTEQEEMKSAEQGQ